MSSHPHVLEAIRISSLAVAVVLAAALTACDSEPTRPTPMPQATFSPIRLEIQGPQRVPPGQTAQLAAIAFAQDGSSRDVSASATWRAFRLSILMVQAGLVSGVAVGESNVEAVYNGLRSTREIIVVPAGTFRLFGSVSEADYAGIPVVDARVEATGGQGAGVQTTTAPDGRYRLYGVAGATTLRVSKDGYQTHTQNLVVTEDTPSLAVALTLVRPRLDISGAYTLTITADPACSGGLLEPLRTRSYGAVLTQVGPQVTVTLTGASFAVSRRGGGDHFTGRIEPTQLVFSLPQFDGYYYGSYGDAYYPNIIEEVAGPNYLAIWGNVAAVGTSGSFSGALDGAFELYSFDPRTRANQNPAARCRSVANRFQLSR
jgi:Carboxypeptidase regulatory-like domain